MSSQGSELKGTLVESIENEIFSQNLKRMGAMFNQVDGYISNLESDAFAVEQYKTKLYGLRKRGFKCQNAISKLEYQHKELVQKIENLKAQKINKLVLLNNDLFELTKQVLEYRLVIDDKETNDIQKYRDELNVFENVSETTFDEVNKLAIAATSHCRDLRDDVFKFEPQINEAIGYRDRNFDIGDLVETLELQMQTTKEKYDMYSKHYTIISNKHALRVQGYLNDLIEESKKLTDATSQKGGESSTTDPEMKDQSTHEQANPGVSQDSAQSNANTEESNENKTESTNTMEEHSNNE